MNPSTFILVIFPFPEQLEQDFEKCMTKREIPPTSGTYELEELDGNDCFARFDVDNMQKSARHCTAIPRGINPLLDISTSVHCLSAGA